jgi:hypothetical protein
MRYTRTLFCVFAIAGCAGEDIQRPPVTKVPPVAPVTSAPTPPAPAAPRAGENAPGVIWVMVVDPSGLCIDDATVQVVSGQRVGPSVVQDADCDAWGYGGGVLFEDLTPGIEMTIRATAPSGRFEEKTVMPSVGWYTATLFTPR